MRLREQPGLQMPKVHVRQNRWLPPEQGRAQRQPPALAHKFHPIRLAGPRRWSTRPGWSQFSGAAGHYMLQNHPILTWGVKAILLLSHSCELEA